MQVLLDRKRQRNATKGAGPGQKEDGAGIELRKRVNALRVKLKTIAKKLAKYGKLGKIPMAAAARIYYENSSDDDSSASSGTESESEADSSQSSDAAPKRRNMVEAQAIYASGLAY